MVEEAWPKVPAFDLSGGRLCLDFTNTVSYRSGPEPQEGFNHYQDLLAWSHQSGLLSRKKAFSLRKEAEKHPRKGRQVVTTAVALRELLYRTFSGVAANQPVESKDLSQLNRFLPEMWKRLGLKEDAGQFEWFWRIRDRELDAMFWPVLRSATDLLTSLELKRVRECAADDCSWLFIDNSRNQARRWCDMSVCGNRDKVRRFRKRQAKR